MTPVHVHLMLNHAPLFGCAVCALLLSFALWRGSEDLKRAAFGLLVISALITIPVYLTGEPAEETVEHFPGVTKAAIHAHESAAKFALAGMIATGIVALIGLLFSWKRLIPNWLTIGMLLLSLFSGTLMIRTANLGGKVRHTEIGGDDQKTIEAHHEEEHEDD